MDGIRQQLFIDYMYYLNETDRFYATKARYAKHVLDFLESASSVDRRGFMAFKREHSTYSKIIANPPFSHNQDIDHVRMMYEFLKEGGTLAAITSKHWEFSDEKKCEDFRAWISSVNGEVFNIPQGEFNCSGTPIETRAIIIRKNVL